MIGKYYIRLTWSIGAIISGIQSTPNCEIANI